MALETKYNSMVFMPEEVEKQLHRPLLDYLIEKYNAESTENYCDIHITTDGYALIIEWAQIPDDRSYGGTFQYVDEEGGCAVMRRVVLDDDTVEYIYADEDEEAYLAERNAEIAATEDKVDE